MLHFAANGRFAILNVPFPVDGFVTYFGQARRTAIDAKINVGEMLILLDFRALLDAQISGISVYNLVIFPEQIGGLRDVMLVCRRNRDRMNQSAAGIYPRSSSSNGWLNTRREVCTNEFLFQSA